METKSKQPTINLRHFEIEDYTEVVKWWEAHKMPVIPLDVLPKPGIVCEMDGGMVGATWMYFSNSNGVALRAWTSVDPELSPMDAYRVIGHLNEFSEIEANANDYSAVLTITGNRGLARINRRQGFTDMEEGIIQLKPI